MERPCCAYFSKVISGQTEYCKAQLWSHGLAICCVKSANHWRSASKFRKCYFHLGKNAFWWNSVLPELSSHSSNLTFLGISSLTDRVSWSQEIKAFYVTSSWSSQVPGQSGASFHAAKVSMCWAGCFFRPIHHDNLNPKPSVACAACATSNERR